MALGKLEKISVNTDLIKSFDLLLMATINADNDGERGQIFGEISYDGGNTWSWNAVASVHYHVGSGTHVTHNSFLLPIPKNTPFRVRTNFAFGTPAAHAWIMSI